MPEAVGVDVGGTFIKAGLVDAGGSVVRRCRVPTEAGSGIDAVEGRIAEAIRSLGPVPAGTTIGIGLAGAVSCETGVVRISPNIPCFEDYPARDRLTRLLMSPVFLDNDANCAALAEAWTGAGRERPSFLLLTLGTGVGGGVMLGGRIWRGDSGRGGEMGHVVVDPGGAACGCGSRGCLETVASSRGILRMAAEAGLEGGVEDLARRARSGSPAEASIFARAGRALGIAVAGWLNILDVHTIIIGGGMLPALDLIEPHMREEACRRAYALDPGSLAVLEAALGDDAGLVGAARLAMLATA